jgi:hypothetical protein
VVGEPAVSVGPRMQMLLHCLFLQHWCPMHMQLCIAPVSVVAATRAGACVLLFVSCQCLVPDCSPSLPQ